MDFSLASPSAVTEPMGSIEGAQAFAPSDSHQAGLTAALTDWASVSDFSDRSAHLLNDTHDPFNHLSHRTIDDKNAFWSSIAGATVLDQITDFAGHKAG